MTNIKILSLLVLITLATGCGKKLTESADVDSQNRNRSSESNLTLVVDEDISLTTNYHVPENALFKLPTELKARFGNAIGKKIEIFYNFSGSGQYEFRCTYSSARKDKTLSLDKCQSQDGYEVFSHGEDMHEIWFPVDKGSRVKLELINPAGTRMNIETAYLVDWK